MPDLLVRTLLGPFILLSLLPLFLGSTATVSSQAPTFGIRPQAVGKGYFEYTLAPGERVQDVLVANNPNDEPLSLNIWIARGRTMAAGGISFPVDTSGPAQWITFPYTETVTVPPTTTLSLPFEVAVPQGTPPGEYIAGFLAKAHYVPADTPPAEGSTGGQGGFEVIVISQVGVAVVITVPEANRCEATISSLSSSSHEARWQLGIAMQNTGNVHFRGSGEVIARLPNNTEPLAQAPFEVHYFIPGDTIDYPLSLASQPPDGEYEVEVNLLTDCGFATTFRQLVNGDQPAAKIDLVKTVGVQADACADTTTLTVSPGETVYYCYTITNTGNITLTDHLLLDDRLGTILTDTVSGLAPGQSLSTLQLGETISTEVVITTTNIATWTANTVEPDLSATDIATATVGLGEPNLALHVIDRFTPSPSDLGTVGGQMNYTITVHNSGTAILKNVKIAFVVPQHTLFTTNTLPMQSASVVPAAAQAWDCPDGAPADTTCTFTIALLSPGEAVLVSVALQIIEELGEALTLEFSAAAEGTPLMPAPAVHVVVTSPGGTQDHYSTYLPAMRSTKSFLPFQTESD